MLNLTPHLTLDEMLSTSHREFLIEQQRAPAEILANLRRFAVDVFEPARELAGALHVTSGYRCFGLNEVVGGATDSRHLEGLAADLVPLELSMFEAFTRIAASPFVPYDQLIWEYGSWIHLGASRHAQPPRRQLLMKFTGTKYEPFDPKDPRVLYVA